MKRFVAQVLALLLSAASAHANDDVKTLSLEITHLHSDGVVEVVLGNESKSALRLWNEDNSWGAGRWRVFCNSQGRLRSFFQASDQIFTMNVPSFGDLRPGERLPLTLHLNTDIWKSAVGSAKASFAPGDVITVVYDVPWSKEASTNHVWVGLVAALRTMK